MPFWEYSQNNSGGGFDYDEQRGISHFVIIEADTAKGADYRAQTAGIYFDGSDYRDCPTCGDRWYEAYGDGDPEPMVYGKVVGPEDPYPPPSKEEPWGMPCWMEGYEGFIHYQNGTVAGFWHGVPPARR